MSIRGGKREGEERNGKERKRGGDTPDHGRAEGRKGGSVYRAFRLIHVRIQLTTSD